MRKTITVALTLVVIFFLLPAQDKTFAQVNPAPRSKERGFTRGGVKRDCFKRIIFMNSLDISRHYFDRANDLKFSKVKRGSSREDIRNLVDGCEYMAFETNRSGFAFSVQEENYNLFIFPGWVPNKKSQIDFFVGKDKVLFVLYKKDRVVLHKVYLRHNQGRMKEKKLIVVPK